MIARRLLSLGAVTILVTAGCSFQGVSSLPLPGTVGHGVGARVYHVQIDNVGTLEPNSPVLIADVIVGSVTKMAMRNWHAEVDISVTPEAVVPGNAVATVGQTSLLGSMHLALDPPPGRHPEGRLAPGSTITLNRSSTYPSTERTLSALSMILNSGGLTQIGDIVHSATQIFHGHENQIRDALNRLDTFIGTLDRQRGNIVDSIDALDRFTATVAGHNDTLTAALHDIPPALDVLHRERPRLTAALTRLATFSDITRRLINDSQHDLVTNLQNLQPALKALADIGPKLDSALALAPTFPFPQNVVDRGVRGDYLNLYAVVDMTIPRLKRTLLAGTRWGDINTQLIPAPGEPYYTQYSYDPLNAPLTPPPPLPPPPAAPDPPAGGH